MAFFNVSKKFKVQRSLNIVCIMCKMLAMFQQEHISIPCFKCEVGQCHPWHMFCFFMNLWACHATPCPIQNSFLNFKIELEMVHLLHKLLYIIYLTSHMLIVCPLSLINYFFCVNFQKNEKNKIKKGIFHCRFPVFCWEKIAKFWKNTRKKFRPISPLPLWLWLQVAIACLNILI